MSNFPFHYYLLFLLIKQFSNWGSWDKFWWVIDRKKMLCFQCVMLHLEVETRSLPFLPPLPWGVEGTEGFWFHITIHFLFFPMGCEGLKCSKFNHSQNSLRTVVLINGEQIRALQYQISLTMVIFLIPTKMPYLTKYQTLSSPHNLPPMNSIIFFSFSSLYSYLSFIFSFPHHINSTSLHPYLPKLDTTSSAILSSEKIWHGDPHRNHHYYRQF